VSAAVVPDRGSAGAGFSRQAIVWKSGAWERCRSDFSREDRIVAHASKSEFL
jgi:hypothetical protein